MVNAYNRFSLPQFWGTGKSASADGTKWNVYEQNLLSEYHLRYGGYGGIGYYHVSDMYIALFSHFIPCGVYEAVYILDGLVKNESDIQPDTLHGDTQAQSAPVFGLSHLLGIKLMPRMRNIKDLVFFKAESGAQYAMIFPNRSTRSEEISAPRRVIAALSGAEKIQSALERALDRQAKVDAKPETAEDNRTTILPAERAIVVALTQVGQAPGQ